MQVINNYNTASMIADFVSRHLAGKNIPTLYEMFPNISKPKSVSEAEDKLALDFYKDQFRIFANNHNAQRRENER